MIAGSTVMSTAWPLREHPATACVCFGSKSAAASLGGKRTLAKEQEVGCEGYANSDEQASPARNLHTASSESLIERVVLGPKLFIIRLL
jgi:hypothetical protein